MIDDYRKNLGGETMPKTWIASVEGKMTGMVRLKKDDHPDKLELTPWLGSLYVHSKFRRMGIATQLCNFLEIEAKKLNFDRLYLFTGTAQQLYESMGYKKIGTVRDTTGLHPNGETLFMKSL